MMKNSQPKVPVAPRAPRRRRRPRRHSLGNSLRASSTRRAASPGQPGVVAAYGFEEGTGTTTADATGNGNTGTADRTTWTTSGRLRQGAVVQRDERPGQRAGRRRARPHDRHDDRGMGQPDGLDRLADRRHEGDGRRPGLRAVRATTARTGRRTSTSAARRRRARHRPHSRQHVDASGHDLRRRDAALLRQRHAGLERAPRPARSSPAPSALRIGGNTVWGEYFTGLIDEVRIYGRALSRAEIQTDMTTPIAQADTTPPTVIARLAGRRRDRRPRRHRTSTRHLQRGDERQHDRRLRRSSCATPPTSSSPRTVTYNAGDAASPRSTRPPI